MCGLGVWVFQSGGQVTTGKVMTRLMVMTKFRIDGPAERVLQQVFWVNSCLISAPFAPVRNLLSWEQGPLPRWESDGWNKLVWGDFLWQTVTFFLLFKCIFLGGFPGANRKLCCHQWSQCSVRTAGLRGRREDSSCCLAGSPTLAAPQHAIQCWMRKKEREEWGHSTKGCAKQFQRDLKKVTCFLQKSRIKGRQSSTCTSNGLSLSELQGAEARERRFSHCVQRAN